MGSPLLISCLHVQLFHDAQLSSGASVLHSPQTSACPQTATQSKDIHQNFGGNGSLVLQGPWIQRCSLVAAQAKTPSWLQVASLATQIRLFSHYQVSSFSSLCPNPYISLSLPFLHTYLLLLVTLRLCISGVISELVSGVLWLANTFWH